MDIKKMIETGADAVKRNPQIKMTDEDLSRILKKNKGNLHTVPIDTYYVGIALGFAMGRKYEQSKVKDAN